MNYNSTTNNILAIFLVLTFFSCNQNSDNLSKRRNTAEISQPITNLTLHEVVASIENKNKEKLILNKYSLIGGWIWRYKVLGKINIGIISYFEDGTCTFQINNDRKGIW